MDKPHISFKPEELFKIFTISITNSLLASILITIIFIVISLYYSSEKNKPVIKRSNLYFFINFAINSLYNFFKSVLGDNIKLYFPILASFFFYIIMQNWFGLIPGVGSLMVKVYSHGGSHFVPLLRAGTADLNTTISLGLISVLLTNYFSIKTLGIKKYINRFYRLDDPVSFFVGSLEIVSELSRVISFSFRLFGNIFAGEVLIAVIAFLIPILAAFPFLILEIFVGFIQAIVFSSLTAVFINSAVEEHH